MKELRALLLLGALLTGAVVALPFVAGAAGTMLVNDTFADGEAVTQALPNSVALYKGRSGTTRTQAVGSVTFDLTNAGGADGFWAFFTGASPVNLAVGDKLAVSGTFSLTGKLANSSAIRFGVLDSRTSRRASDLTGGMSDTSFSGDTGYGLSFATNGTGRAFVINRRTTLTSNNVFSAGADFTTILTGAAGDPAAPTLNDETPYTLT